MKLSEAMRLGAMLKPQVREDYRRSGGTCAIGAALDACGVLGSLGEPRIMAERRWPALMEPMVSHPITKTGGHPMWDVIITLNDYHKWTREQIADWVETIENAQTTPATSREEASTVALSVTTSASAAPQRHENFQTP